MLNTYQQLLTIARQNQLPQLESFCHIQLAREYSKLGQYETALKSYKRALQLVNRYEKADLLNEIGELFLARNESYQALNYLNEALNIHCETGNLSKQVNILNQMGDIYLTIGQTPQAFFHFASALPIAKKLDNRPLKMITLINLSLTYHAMEQAQEALDYYNQSLKLVRKMG